MLTLKIKNIIALFRSYNKVLSTINNLVEILSRYNNYKKFKIIKNILYYFIIR